MANLAETKDELIKSLFIEINKLKTSTNQNAPSFHNDLLIIENWLNELSSTNDRKSLHELQMLRANLEKFMEIQTLLNEIANMFSNSYSANNESHQQIDQKLSLLNAKQKALDMSLLSLPQKIVAAFVGLLGGILGAVIGGVILGFISISAMLTSVIGVTVPLLGFAAIMGIVPGVIAGAIYGGREAHGYAVNQISSGTSLFSNTRTAIKEIRSRMDENSTSPNTPFCPD